MIRKTLLAGMIAAFAVALGGCEIYFGPDDCDTDYCDDYYEYCDETGCYWCDSWGCYPDVPPGYPCDDNNDCGPGCYCDEDGTCTEGGFCNVDWECPEGFVCDDRSTCVPEETDVPCENNGDCPMGTYCDDGTCTESSTCCGPEDCPPNHECDDRGTCVPVACTDDDQCVEGYVCDLTTGSCTETSTCAADGSCPEGYECDTDRNTCVACEGGFCGCEANPDCDAGEYCNTEDGVCYVPTCEEIGEEALCLSREECQPVYTGYNCTDPDGNECIAGSTDCTCETFAFHECEAIQ